MVEERKVADLEDKYFGEDRWVQPDTFELVFWIKAFSTLQVPFINVLILTLEFQQFSNALLHSSLLFMKIVESFLKSRIYIYAFAFHRCSCQFCLFMDFHKYCN